MSFELTFILQILKIKCSIKNAQANITVQIILQNVKI